MLLTNHPKIPHSGRETQLSTPSGETLQTINKKCIQNILQTLVRNFKT